MNPGTPARVEEASRWRHGMGRVALLLSWPILVVVVLVGRELRDGQMQMVASDQAFNRGDVWAAVVHARRAASSFVPGASHQDRAYARLEAAAAGAESRGDFRLARVAYRAIRGAALETKHFEQPRKAELDLANRKLAWLEVREENRPPEEFETRYPVSLRRLEPETGSVGIGFGILGVVALGGVSLGWVFARGPAKSVVE